MSTAARGDSQGRAGGRDRLGDDISATDTAVMPELELT